MLRLLDIYFYLRLLDIYGNQVQHSLQDVMKGEE